MKRFGPQPTHLPRPRTPAACHPFPSHSKPLRICPRSEGRCPIHPHHTASTHTASAIEADIPALSEQELFAVSSSRRPAARSCRCAWPNAPRERRPCATVSVADRDSCDTMRFAWPTAPRATSNLWLSSAVVNTPVRESGGSVSLTRARFETRTGERDREGGREAFRIARNTLVRPSQRYARASTAAPRWLRAGARTAGPGRRSHRRPGAIRVTAPTCRRDCPHAHESRSATGTEEGTDDYPAGLNRCKDGRG